MPKYGTSIRAESRPGRWMTARLNRILVGVSITLCFVMSCGPDKDVVATYRGGEIRAKDLELRIMSLPESQRHPGKSQSMEDWKRRIAAQLSLERTLIPPERLVPEDGVLLRPGPRRRLLVREMMQREGTRQVDVPEDSLLAYYERNWARFFIPPGVTFQHVFLPLSQAATQAERAHVRARAESVRALADAGADFDELVQQFSSSESRGWQGRVGMMFRGQLPPSIESVVFALDEGDMGGPLVTEHGYHIFKVIERSPEEMKPFKEVAPRIRRELMTAQLDSMRDAFVDSLRQEITVELKVGALIADIPETTTVFRVGDEAATKGEVMSWLAAHEVIPKDHDELEQILRGVAMESQLYQKALALGFAEDEIARERYRAWIGTSFVDSVLGSGLNAVAIEADILRGHYAKHRTRFAKPQTWHVREIVIQGTEDQRLQAWEKANEVVKRLRDESFADLARAHSSAASAGNGGDLGELTLRETAKRGPGFQKSLFSLEEGEMSDVVRIDGGYLILKLESISEPVERDYAEVMDLVRNDYVDRNRSSLLTESLDQRLREMTFRYHGAGT